MKEEDITGSLVNSFMVCQKKCWLQARQINPTKSNQHLLLGSAYSNARGNHVRIGNIELDELQKGKSLIVKEYKKTFSNLEASEMQLLFYMSNLKSEMNLKDISGYIISEESDEKKYIPYSSENEKILQKTLAELLDIVNNNTAPKFEQKPLCTFCGHNLYCL